MPNAYYNTRMGDRSGILAIDTIYTAQLWQKSKQIICFDEKNDKSTIFASGICNKF